MRRISLSLVIHNHQPVGNFGWVIEDVYQLAYEPMVGALERHPTIKLALHYSGPLLEWLAAERPALIERLRALVGRGQVEIVGGALYEPILAALPVRDRVAQLRLMRERVAQLFGVTPAGAWLAERVWEPSLASDLATAGYAWTVLDDNHLREAHAAPGLLWHASTTDDQGRRLTLLATEQGLRYRIPWRPVNELIAYLRESATEAGDRIGVMGDDGEKFGAWPGTYETCWGDAQWVELCFLALEESSGWLRTVTPTAWLAEHAPEARIYVPSSSYVEMTEWALPATEQHMFHALLEQARAKSLPELRFLSGALWRNFQARYREINDLHKQMLRVSDAVEAMAPGATRDAARDHLYRGQSNDCYWHGWFGGLYINHMRMATLAELIAAEDLALGEDAWLAGIADYDLDGVDEVALGTNGQTVIVDIAEGCGIGSWDLRLARVALAAVLRRRPEAYHAKLKGLVYDDHERRSGLVRVLDATGLPHGGFDTGAWALDQAVARTLNAHRGSDGLMVRKTVTVDGGRAEGTLAVALEVVASSAFSGTLELEWNLNLLGGGGNPAAYYRSGAQEWRHDSTGAVAAGARLVLGNTYLGVELGVTANPPAATAWSPVETASNSETGIERTYQGSCLIQRWPLKLAAGQTATATATVTLTNRLRVRQG